MPVETATPATQADFLASVMPTTEPAPATAPSAVVPPATVDPATAEPTAAVVSIAPSDPKEPAVVDPAAPTEGAVTAPDAMAKINELVAQIAELQAKVSKGEPAPVPDAPATQYVTQEDIDSGALSSIEGLNKILARTAAQSMETTLQRIPEIVNKAVLVRMAEKAMVDSFYEANKDLSEHKALVGMFANKVFSENPTLTVDKILPLAAKEARAVVETVAKTKKPSALPTPPNPTTPSGTQTSAPDLAGQAKYLADLFA